MRALFWVVLTLAGYAATLALISAGPALGYQHYLPPRDMVNHPVALGVIALQLGAVLLAMRGTWHELLQQLRSAVPGWRIGALLVLMLAAAAVPGYNVARFGVEVLTAVALQILALLSTVVTVRLIPAPLMERLRGALGSLIGAADSREQGREAPVAPERLVVAVSIATVLACCILFVFAYNRHPHIPDEVAYLYQARTLATLRLTVPAPPVAAPFEMYLFASDSLGYYTPVPPGWPAVLALGVAAGVPWLVNPLLTGLNVVLLWYVLRGLYDNRVARAGIVLFAVSPWNLFLGMGYMPHALTLCCALLATLGVMRTRRSGQIRWAWYGGLALGLLAAVRQLDAMIVAGALGLWSIGLGGKRIRLGGTVGLVLASMFATIPLLAFNRFFTGKWGVFPLMSYIDRVFGKGANDYGFGANRGMGWPLDPNPGHGPVDATINTALNLAATQVEFLGWSVGSLLLVFVVVLRGGLRQADRILLGVIAITWLAYFFNYYSGGPEFGARYWFLMIVPGVALTARALLGDAPDERSLSLAGSRRLAAAGLWTLGALLVFVPWRAVDKYRTLRGMRPDVVALHREQAFGNGLVFIDGPRFPDYASAAVLNPLDFSANVPIYARRTTPEADRELVNAYAGRPVYFLDGPAKAGKKYVVTAGPLETAEALAHLTGEAR